MPPKNAHLQQFTLVFLFSWYPCSTRADSLVTMAMTSFEWVQTNVLAAIYGSLVLLDMFRVTIQHGYKKSWTRKIWLRPACLDNPADLGHHSFIIQNGIKIHYVASGPEDKPLMLFIHGFPEFWFSWRHQIREFQKDFRVVAIDQRGEYCFYMASIL